LKGPADGRLPYLVLARQLGIKIRARFIGVGNGVVVAKLNVDGLPLPE
jgi:hypothetical protein